MNQWAWNNIQTCGKAYHLQTYGTKKDNKENGRICLSFIISNPVVGTV